MTALNKLKATGIGIIFDNENLDTDEKYTRNITRLDFATQEYVFEMKVCIVPIIFGSEFRILHEERVEGRTAEVDEK